MKLIINCADELTVARIVAALQRENLRLVSRQKNARVGEVLFDLRDGAAPTKPTKPKSYQLIEFPRTPA